MESTEATESSADDSAIPIATGAAVGAVAYIVGYLTTYVFVLVESGQSLIALLVTADDFQQVGWLFYNAPYVPLNSASYRGPPTNLLEETTNLTTPRPLWTIAVIVVLMIAGYAVAARTTGHPVVAGAAVVVGYLPLMLIGTVVFRDTILNELFVSVPVAPETLPAIAAGISLPVVCGGVGGFLNDAVTR